MKSKWKPVTRYYELTETAIITMSIKGLNPFTVTLGLPGYGLQNGTVAYMPLPKNIDEGPAAWKSEYRGDELPDMRENRRYIVQLQGISAHNQSKLKIADLCYLAKERRWLAVPHEWEVIAWMEYPKPYIAYSSNCILCTKGGLELKEACG